MSTIENINNIVRNKLQYLSNIIKICKKYKTSDADNVRINKYSDEIDNIYKSFNSSFIMLMTRYFSVSSNEEKSIAYTNVIKYLYAENLESRLNLTFEFCDYMYRTYKFTEDVTVYLNLFTSQNINIENLSFKIDKCKSCGSNLELDIDTNEIICLSCGYMEIASTEDTEYKSLSDGKPIKSSDYQSLSHTIKWLKQLQAKEKKTIPNEVSNEVLKELESNRIYGDNITTEELRNILKRLKYSNWNKHIPLIKKIITGIEPATLTDSEETQVINYLFKSITILSELKNTIQASSSGPYFIYKIIEQILPDTDDRKIRLLSSIHLQENKTLIKNDKIWEEICLKINEINPNIAFKYIPTLV